MIVLKNLAREFDIDPYKLRVKLRGKFGKRRRWRWDEKDKADMRDYQRVRKFLQEDA